MCTMLRTLLCAAFLLVPVQALGCVYVNNAGQSLTPSTDGSGFIFSGGMGAPPLDCRVTSPPEQVGSIDVDCSWWQGQMIVGPSGLGADDLGIIVFQSSFFFLACE